MEEGIKYYIKIVLIAIIGIIIGYNTSVKEVKAIDLAYQDEIRIWNLQWTKLVGCENNYSCAYSSSSNNIFFLGGWKDNINLPKGTTINIYYEVSIIGRNGNYNDNEPFSVYYRNSSGNNIGQVQCSIGGYSTEKELSESGTLTNTKHILNCNAVVNVEGVAGIGWSTQVSNWNYVTVVMNAASINVVQNNQDIINNQNQNTDKILNEGTFVKPEEDIQIKDSEEKEEQIYDLFEGVDINAITIDFDSTSVTKIFELLNRIITQNTIIQTMIITILSISIIKLVLGR